MVYFYIYFGCLLYFTFYIVFSMSGGYAQQSSFYQLLSEIVIVIAIYVSWGISYVMGVYKDSKHGTV